MSKKVVKEMIRIVNGKQPQTIKIREGYLNLLPKEETLVSESSMTQDIYSKVRAGILKIENVSEEVPSVEIVEKTTN